MNRFSKLFVVVIIFATFFNCSSVKLSDSWSSDTFEVSKNNKLLVIARSNDIEVRKAYEDELSAKLRAKGIDAISAYKAFPNLKDKVNRSEDETAEIVKQFKDSGIENIMLLALKETKIQESSSMNGDQDYSISTSRGRYGLSFSDYYSVHSIEYLSRNLKPIYNDSGTSNDLVLKSTTYIIEAVVYDLTVDKENQLLSVYEVEATDPSSAEQILNKFSDLIVKQF